MINTFVLQMWKPGEVSHFPKGIAPKAVGDRPTSMSPGLHVQLPPAQALEQRVLSPGTHFRPGFPLAPQSPVTGAQLSAVVSSPTQR